MENGAVSEKGLYSMPQTGHEYHNCRQTQIYPNLEIWVARESHCMAVTRAAPCEVSVQSASQDMILRQSSWIYSDVIRS